MTKLDRLAALLRQAPDEVFLQPHNVPDPDAIASAFALKHLLEQKGIETSIVYESELEKINSLKMLELFQIDLRLSKDVDTLGREDWTVLVDVQKGNTNVTDLVTDEVAVIDHHEHMGGRDYRFADIRPEVGACSTIIAEYFSDNGEPIPPPVATALLYGILIDTDSLTRGVSDLDIDMFYYLYNKTDISLITELKSNQITRKDLGDYARAFSTVEVYGEIGFLFLDNCNDSLLGAASDIVTTIQGVDVVVAYALRETGIKFSIRSIDRRVKANELVRYLLDGVGFGGGHGSMAGGFLPSGNLQKDRNLDTFVRHRAISFLESRG